MNNICEKTKRAGGAQLKSQKYKTERIEILNELLQILNINKLNRVIIINDLEKDSDKINRIMNLKEQVRKCFTCKNYAVFKNEATTQHPHRSLIRLVLKEMNYDITIIRDHIKKNNTTTQWLLYIIDIPV